MSAARGRARERVHGQNHRRRRSRCCAPPATGRRRRRRSRSSRTRPRRAGAASPPSSSRARSGSPSASSASTSSHVSAPVTQGRSSTQRMPSPSTTKSSQRSASRSAAASPAHGAAQDRVVPVHGVARLGVEQVLVLAQGVPQPTRGQLPLRLGLVDRSLSATPQAARGRCSSCPRPARCPTLPPRSSARPRDAAEGQLHRGDHGRAPVVPPARRRRRTPGPGGPASGATRPTAT